LQYFFFLLQVFIIFIIFFLLYNSINSLKTFINYKYMNNNKKKIVDCFIFYNEIELLYYRLNLLYQEVDYFVIVEANQTHAGNPKDLYFIKHQHLFEPFLDKIIHIIVDLPLLSPQIDCSKNEQWVNEKFHRNCIQLGIDKLQGNLSDNDIITITDLDEIVHPETLKSIQTNDHILEGFSLEMDMYYYNLHCKHKDKWYLPKVVSYQLFKKKKPDELRFTNFPEVKQGGWHLSYFGDEFFIQNKIKQFAHQEFNKLNYTNTDTIKNKILLGIDLFNRSDVPITIIPIEENNALPLFYNTFLKNYYNI